MLLLLRLLINALTFYLIAMYVPGFHVADFKAAIIAAVIFGVVNALIRPVVLLISLPFTILTLGIFVLIVNAFMFWLTARISPGLRIDSFGAAFIGSLIMLVVGTITSHLLRSDAERAVVTR